MNKTVPTKSEVEASIKEFKEMEAELTVRMNRATEYGYTDYAKEVKADLRQVQKALNVAVELYATL